ncbi:alanine racemase [Oceanobacillus polygoni]|uniref:Alanine racemase n=1 Tax=Oceanobacillus polygoni TaxID=1235259 RepID=A0A9X1CCT9_9BACI|nr:alanine racemase [Oceanobacillus polygoni]MBP2078356.1 alanine racemase [Oceanobacillus polygoni]
MMYGSYRDTWTEVSLDAIEANVQSFRRHIGASGFMAVVKADGYGHGAVQVATAAVDAGADYLGVALLDEALQLREAGIDTPILVLGYTAPHGIEEAVKHDITLTVFSDESVAEMEQAASVWNKQAKVHLKIDSGMNRIGIRDQNEALQICESFVASKKVELEGIFTHFADADNPDSAYTYQQFKNFMALLDYLNEHQIQIPLKHCCNSAATIIYPEMHLDMVRVGISLYGLYPSEHMRDKLHLKQAMSLKTKPAMIKEVKSGHPISYGCTYTPEVTSVIATLPVGYADGLSRQLSNMGHMTVKGVRVPIVGRVCMDQTMIDVTAAQQMSKADVVTIFGDPDDGYISLGEVANHMQTIHYETVCLIGKRVPRVYVTNATKL